MHLYQNGDIKIRSAKISKYVTVSNRQNWILLDNFVFQLWLNIVNNDSDYERAVIHKSNGQIEILNICGNFMLCFSSGRGFQNNVLVRKDQCKHILQNRSLILKNYNENLLKTELPGNVSKNVTENNITKNPSIEKTEINNETKSINKNETPKKRPLQLDIDMNENYHCNSQLNSQKYFYKEDQYGEGL